MEDWSCSIGILFLSTPSARRATFFLDISGRGTEISIHALREEGDFLTNGTNRATAISIHALREEGDRNQMQQGFCATQFLSTPSARRATGHRYI